MENRIANPEMNGPIEDLQSESQLQTPFLIRLDDNPLLKKLLRDPTQLSNPLQDILSPLRRELTLFIRATQKPVPQLGFRSTPPDAVSTSALEEKLEASSKLLEEIIESDAYGLPEYIAYKSFANVLQTRIDLFSSLLQMNRSTVGIPLQAAGDVAQFAAQLRAELGSMMVQADAVSMGISLGEQE